MKKIERYVGCFRGMIKTISLLSVLTSAVIFTSVAQAASEITPTSLVPTAAVNKPVQLTYYRYHRHGWYHGRWHRWHGRYYRYWYRY